MRNDFARTVAAAVLLANMAAGCDKLGGRGSEVTGPPEVPSEQELHAIRYLSAAETNGRKLYNHFEKARTCGDYELAQRWNRPPNVPGGSFGQKMVYLTSTVPADLPKDSEVFIRGTIVKGAPLVSGGEAWYLRMKDGTLVQAAEMADFMQKQDQDTQGDKLSALNNPNKPGRAFCGTGIYQGVLGKDPEQPDKKVPLFSIMYAMDRDE
jgi:hypothetical protein